MAKIVIPTPALSECLVYAGPAGAEYLTILGKQSCFRIASFDERAAIEAAIRTFDARQRGQRKGGNPADSKAEIKFDRQIVAVATVEGASAVYSDDEALRGYAIEAGMDAYRLADLPLPPEDPQKDLPFGPGRTSLKAERGRDNHDPILLSSPNFVKLQRTRIALISAAPPLRLPAARCPPSHSRHGRG
nr:hypothetical protein [uncultured Rhodopila sp.]